MSKRVCVVTGVGPGTGSALGPASVLIHNAVGGAFGDFQQIEPAVLQRNFAVNVMALLHLARAVAPAMIDAVIDVPWARQQFRDKPDDFFAKPSAIAEVAFGLAHQDRSAWEFDVVVRPFREPW